MCMNMSLRSSNMRKSIFILCGLMLLLASCKKNTHDVLQGQPIYLSVRLPEDSQTKVPFEGTAPTTSNPLDVAVWASTTMNKFKNEGYNGSEVHGRQVSIHTTGHFQSGDPQLLSEAIYPPPRIGEAGSYTADPVYFVALHPQEGWSTDKEGDNELGKKAMMTFSGNEDLMFAPQVSGAYDTNEQSAVVTDSPVLSFEHLLTRITVKMGIALEQGENLLDAQNAWGKITGLSIQSYNKEGEYGVNLNKVSIDLSDGNVDFTGIQGQSMNFYSLGEDTVFPGDSGFELTEKIDSVAYVMCAPVSATSDSHEYIIIVSTENRGDLELELDLEKVAGSAEGIGSTKGNHFLVTLKFKKGRAIASEVVVTNWVNGGFGSGEIED